jgi:hypothetical protein
MTQPGRCCRGAHTPPYCRIPVSPFLYSAYCYRESKPPLRFESLSVSDGLSQANRISGRPATALYRSVAQTQGASAPVFIHVSLSIILSLLFKFVSPRCNFHFPLPPGTNLSLFLSLFFLLFTFSHLLFLIFLLQPVFSFFSLFLMCISQNFTCKQLHETEFFFRNQ